MWTLGLYSAMGFSFNILTSMLTPLVVVLAIADDVHIVQHFDHELRATGSKEHAFKSSVSHLFAPLLGASGTTALGMLSLATSDVVAVRTFGIGAAIGVMVDFAHVAGVRADTADVGPAGSDAAAAGALADGAASAARPVRVGHAGSCPGRGRAVGRAARPSASPDCESIPITSTSCRRPPAVAVRGRRRSAVVGHLQLQHPARGTAGFVRTSRTAWCEWSGCRSELRRLPYVRKVTSVADYVKRVNQQLTDGDRQTRIGLPAREKAIAQELFVFGLSEEGRVELSRVVASDYSRAHICGKAGLDELGSGVRADRPGRSSWRPRRSRAPP